MPKPEKKEQQDVIVQDDDLDTKKPEQDDGIEIPLDDNGEPLSPEAKKKQEEDEAKSKEEEQRKKNAEFAQRRIDQDKQRLKQENEDLKRRMADLEKKSSVGDFTHRPDQRFVTKDKSYWEKRLADDPVGALEEFEEHKHNERLKQQMEQRERQSMVESWQSTLEESKSMAVEEFPSLEDENSPEFTMFMDILGKHPEWRNSPIGPVKVVKEMKKIMADGKGGNDVISKTRNEAAIEERQRQARINSQPLSNSRNLNTGNKIVLTKEQMSAWEEHFKDRGITLEKYAKMVNVSKGEKEVII